MVNLNSSSYSSSIKDPFAELKLDESISEENLQVLVQGLPALRELGKENSMASLPVIEVPKPDQNTIWLFKEYGIRARKEFKKYISNSLFRNVLDLGSAWARGASYSAMASYKRMYAKYTNHRFPKFDDSTPIGTDFKAEKLGLAILFHGLNGQPSLWDDHISLLEKNALDIYAPEVPDAGHRSLEDETSYKLFNRVADWTKRNPGKPISIFGQSNGTRFALFLETWLRAHAPQTPVHVSLTAGVLFGTTTADMANTLLGADKYPLGLLSPSNGKELALGAEMAKKLLEEARKPLEKEVSERHFVMYSPLLPMIDIHVPNTGSSLPILVPDGQESKSEKHYLVPDYGHNAIVTALAERQVAECLEWMKSKNKKMTIEKTENQ